LWGLLTLVLLGVSFTVGVVVTPYATQIFQSKTLDKKEILNVFGVKLVPTLTSIPIPTPTPTLTPAQFGERTIELVNQERNKIGLKQLRVNELLNNSAKAKAEDMLNRNYWSHKTPEGIEPWSFIKKAGYKYQYSGENLARDFQIPEGVVTGWMKSKEHKDNILNPEYTETGVYVNKGRLEGWSTILVVQHFGKPLNFNSESIGIINSNISALPFNLNSLPTTSRSGQIVSYHDWCNNKDTSVYQGELITLRSTDGNVYSMTREDWVCYEKFLSTRRR
jgi:uncharacterized protein YkwD